MKVSFMKHRPKILPYSAARWIGKTPNRFCKFTSAPFSSKIFATFTAPVCKEVRNYIKNIFWELEMAIFTIQRGHVKRTFAVFIFCINVSSVCNQQFCNVCCVYSWKTVQKKNISINTISLFRNSSNVPFWADKWSGELSYRPLEFTSARLSINNFATFS